MSFKSKSTFVDHDKVKELFAENPALEAEIDQKVREALKNQE